jgi:hypothetical protein
MTEGALTHQTLPSPIPLSKTAKTHPKGILNIARTATMFFLSAESIEYG